MSLVLALVVALPHCPRRRACALLDLSHPLQVDLAVAEVNLVLLDLEHPLVVDLAVAQAYFLLISWAEAEVDLVLLDLQRPCGVEVASQYGSTTRQRRRRTSPA